MRKQLSAISYQLSGTARRISHFLKAESPPLAAAARARRGFTLIETLAAILLITVAIVAPMALTVQSLESAYYARDQITASNLAQEGIEAVRSVRDGNILATARGAVTPLFQGIPTGGPFTIDAHTIPAALTACSSTPCPASQATLETNGTLYGYGTGWTATNFQRYANATTVWSDGTGAQEINITVVVSWQTAAYKIENITLSEDLYNWPSAGSAS
jgi:prepilin-type N-terminal cleavage/methylation domain-containing protein